MRVKIGPYRNFIGPYQISGLLKYLGVSEDYSDKMGDKLADTWVNDLCLWIDSKKKRKIVVRIDSYDTWSMDHTLSLIILPMLRQLKDTQHGAGYISDLDVPENLKSTSAPPKKNSWDTDDNHFKRWEYVLDEMIFAFEAQASDDWESQFHQGEIDLNRINENTHNFDKIGYDQFYARMKNGFRLFGTYYNNLWD